MTGDDRDEIQFGPQGPGWRRPRWLPFVVAAVVAVLVVVAVVRGGSPSTSPAAGTPTPTRSPTSDESPTAPTAPRPRVVELHHRLLGVTTGWELFAFARTPETVVRVQLARGRVTYTQIPVLQSTGPVSFVVGPHRAIVRPLDLVPGYAVPDGQRARELSGPLGYAGPTIPGPEPSQVWVPSQRDQHRMLLVGLDGRGMGVYARGSTRDVSTAGATSDGGGYLLVEAAGGVYQGRPDGLHRITTGAVRAVGRTGWLAVECEHGRRCRKVLIDRATGTRRVVPGGAEAAGKPTGVISPDGSIAAVYHVTPAGRLDLHLLDLRSGADHLVREAGATSFAGDALAWSPDSRRLFVASSGKLLAVDARTRRVTRLPVALPPISQLAIRAD